MLGEIVKDYEIAKDYPSLTKEEVLAVMLYSSGQCNVSPLRGGRSF
jgi:hypothetical protein